MNIKIAEVIELLVGVLLIGIAIGAGIIRTIYRLW